MQQIPIVLPSGVAENFSQAICSKYDLETAYTEEKVGESDDAKKFADLDAVNADEAGLAKDAALDRLRKYIPTEIIGMWTMLKSAIQNYVPEKDKWEWSLGWFLATVVLGCIYTFYMGRNAIATLEKQDKKARWRKLQKQAKQQKEPPVTMDDPRLQQADEKWQQGIDDLKFVVVGQALISAIAFACFAVIDGPPFTYLDNYPKYVPPMFIAVLPVMFTFLDPLQAGKQFPLFERLLFPKEEKGTDTKPEDSQPQTGGTEAKTDEAVGHTKGHVHVTVPKLEETAGGLPGDAVGDAQHTASGGESAANTDGMPADAFDDAQHTASGGASATNGNA